MQEQQHNQDFQEENSKNEQLVTTYTRRPVKTYLVATAILVVALIIVSAVKDKKEELDNTVTVMDLNGNIVVTINDGTEKKNTDPTLLQEGYELKTFEDLDEAGLIINSTQGKPTSGEGSESLVSMVVPAEDENMVYFATKSVHKELGEVFVGIYFYNTISNRWQRVFKTTYDITEHSSPFLRILAKTGEQLILLKDPGNKTMDTCQSYWLVGETEDYELLQLDLNDPYSGFTTFLLPDVLRQKAESEKNECLRTNE